MARNYYNTSPIGTNIKIENVNFKVIGVLAPRGTSPMGMDRTAAS
jgi:hypothetical protein